MSSINPYLTFDGDCAEAFEFYKSIFGGEYTYISTFADMPPSDEFTIAEEHKSRIMHVSLPIGSSVLMGSDTAGNNPPVVQGSNFSISYNAENRDDVDRVFNALAEGGKITMPLQDTFWNSYFGMCTDKFGFEWMVSFENPTG